jgi:hypothetical protein
MRLTLDSFKKVIAGMDNALIKHNDYDELLNWFEPFISYIAEYGFEDEEGLVVLNIPYNLYNWNNVDIDELRKKGVIRLQIERKGKLIYDLFNFGAAVGYNWTHWIITIHFKGKELK